MRRLNTILLSAGMVLLMGVTATTARCQEKQAGKAPALQHHSEGQAQFYRHILQTDSVKAGQVAEIQRDYKSGMALLMGDTSLSEVGKRAKMGELVEAKNAKLRSILSPAQQERIIPSTERMRPKGVAKETHPVKP